MSGLKKSVQFGSLIRHNEDTLTSLCQIDIDENIPIEEEVLILMVKLLRNLEEFKELRDDRRKIIAQGELMETRLLGLLQVLRARN